VGEREKGDEKTINSILQFSNKKERNPVRITFLLARQTKAVPFWVFFFYFTSRAGGFEGERE
jgi:hypothetical protein